jgi:excisionase family DNA binding protein
MNETTDSASGHGRPLRFLTLRQVAEELNTRDSTIRALIRSGELQALQIGGRGQWRIERAKLEDYITAAYARTAQDLHAGETDPGGCEPAEPQAPESPD